jgi:hypothetical protein
MFFRSRQGTAAIHGVEVASVGAIPSGRLAFSVR